MGSAHTLSQSSILSDGRGPWTPLCMQQLQAQQRSYARMKCWGSQLPLRLSKDHHCTGHESFGVQDSGGMREKRTQSAIPLAPLRTRNSWERWEWQLSDSRGRKRAGVSKTKSECGPQWLHASPMSRPRSSELELLLLLRLLLLLPRAAARLLATRARSSVAWGGFLATLCSEHTQPPKGWEPPSGGPTELEHPIPAHRLPRLSLILPGYSPESISCQGSGWPGSWADWVGKDKGTQLPAGKASGTALPSPVDSSDALLGACGRRPGLLRRPLNRSPSCWHPSLLSRQSGRWRPWLAETKWSWPPCPPVEEARTDRCASDSPPPPTPLAF